MMVQIGIREDYRTCGRVWSDYQGTSDWFADVQEALKILDCDCYDLSQVHKIL